MEVLDSLRQKKIKFFCPILDTSTYHPPFVCCSSGAKRSRSEGGPGDDGACRYHDHADLPESQCGPCEKCICEGSSERMSAAASQSAVRAEREETVTV